MTILEYQRALDEQIRRINRSYRVRRRTPGEFAVDLFLMAVLGALWLIVVGPIWLMCHETFWIVWALIIGLLVWKYW